MLEQTSMMNTLYQGIVPTLQSCGFAPVMPTDHKKGDTPVYEREKASVIDFSGEKGKLRFLFNENRVHLLSGASDIESDDDSQYSLDCTYLCILDEYTEKDIKSLVNEINEYVTDTFSKKAKIVSKSKAPATVSKAAAKSGALSYDSITLASKIAGMFPELKDEIKSNVDTYGEFLCEDFFVNHANVLIEKEIRENNNLRMRKLFNIFGEVYEDGTNEVQSLIAVTILGFVKNDPTLVQQIMPYLTDTMLEPILSVSKKLGKSKSSRMRLDNPPKYKPKKKKEKSGGILSQLGL